MSENLKKLIQGIGRETPFLNYVLQWHSKEGRNKYSHFEVSNGKGYFSIYDGEEKDSLLWDLNYTTLSAQSEELIEWLSSLI